VSRSTSMARWRAAICWSVALSCSFESPPHALLEDRRPPIELRPWSSRRQRVLVLGAAQPAAEGEILGDLKVDVHGLDFSPARAARAGRTAGPETSRWDRAFSWTNRRARFSEGMNGPVPGEGGDRSAPRDPAAGRRSPCPVARPWRRRKYPGVPSTVMKTKPVSCWGNRPLGIGHVQPAGEDGPAATVAARGQPSGDRAPSRGPDRSGATRHQKRSRRPGRSGRGWRAGSRL